MKKQKKKTPKEIILTEDIIRFSDEPVTIYFN